jgi:hypothetical protein
VNEALGSIQKESVFEHKQELLEFTVGHNVDRTSALFQVRIGTQYGSGQMEVKPLTTGNMTTDGVL